MKLVKFMHSSLVAMSVALCVSCLVPFSSLADIFVSRSGSDDNGGSSWEDAMATIKAALKKAVDGDTVWVENGYVCSIANGDTAYDGTYFVSVPAGVVLRSRSGTLEDCATIDALDASRVALYLNSRTTLRGIAVINGSSTSANAANVISKDKTPYLENCLIAHGRNTGRGVAAGIYQGVLSHCVISNNYASYTSSGTTTQYGGARACILTNCVITCNWSDGNGYSSGIDQSEAYKCLFTGNKGGSVTTRSFCEKCDFTGNFSMSCGTFLACNFWKNVGSNGGGVGKSSVAVDCFIEDNDGTGAKCDGPTKDGTLQKTYLTNCVVRLNRAGGIRGGNDTAAGKIEAVRCQIVGNTVTSASNCGALYADLYDCIIAENENRGYAGGASGGREGGAVISSTAYNCLVYSNHSCVGSAAARNSSLWNCTLFGNSSTNNSPKATYVCKLFNTISYDNRNGSSTIGENNVTCATNCVTASTLTGAGNIKGDPMLDTLPGKGWLMPLKGSPCIDTCTNDFAYAWMTDKADVRSKDVRKKSRVYGTAADGGAIEYRPVFGMGVIVR